MKIKIIAVGSSGFERFIRRWGVSFLIGDDILFDTFGDPGVFANNLRRFKVDLQKIKHVVLSHDHWDHISGLWHILAGRKDIAVYICPGFRQEIKERIAAFGVRLIEVEEFTAIKEGIFLSGQLKAAYSGEEIFEQVLVIKFLKSLALITGCAHPGIVNIVDRVQEHFVKERVYSILGGFHLKENTPAVNLGIIEKLRERGVRKIAPLHCTGKAATRLMLEKFGYGFMRVNEGDLLEL